MVTQDLSKTHIIILCQGLDQEETKTGTAKKKAVTTEITVIRTIAQTLCLN
jgi:hypothetical protein